MNSSILSTNIMDIISIILVSLYSFTGLYYGFFRTLFNNLLFVLSVILLILIYPYSKNFLNFYIKNEILLVLSNIIVLYLMFITFTVSVKSITKPVIDNLSVGVMNNVLGACIGFAKGCILLLIVFTMLVTVNTGLYKQDHMKDKISTLDKKLYPHFMIDSKLFSLLDSYMKGLIVYVPDSIIDQVQSLQFTHSNDKK